MVMLRSKSLVKPLLLDNNIWITSFSFIFRISKLIALRLSKRTVRRWEKFLQRMKKWQVSTASREQGPQWVLRILKIMFKFTFTDTAKPRRRVGNFKRETSLIPKVLFAVVQKKSKKALRNTAYEGAWHIEGSSLFHSFTA